MLLLERMFANLRFANSIVCIFGQICRGTEIEFEGFADAIEVEMIFVSEQDGLLAIEAEFAGIFGGSGFALEGGGSGGMLGVSDVSGDLGCGCHGIFLAWIVPWESKRAELSGGVSGLG